MNYQIFDYNCYDYQLWNLAGVGVFRGPDPRPLKSDEYICCLGAAATFGRFSNLSYPEMLTKMSKLKTVNFGVSAAGPQYFLENQKIIDIANQSKVIVMEVLSARSCSTSLFSSIGGKNVFLDRNTGEKMHERDIYPPLFEQGNLEKAEQLIEEARETWVQEMTQLISKFTKPCILLWNSKRFPDFKQNKKAYGGYIGKYPQMVNQNMLDRLSPLVDEIVYSIDIDDPVTVFESKFFGGNESCRVGHALQKEWGYYPSKSLLYKTAKSIALRIVPESPEVEIQSLSQMEADYEKAFLTIRWRTDRFLNMISGICSELSFKIHILEETAVTATNLDSFDVIVFRDFDAKCQTTIEGYTLGFYVASLNIAIYSKSQNSDILDNRVKAVVNSNSIPYFTIDKQLANDVCILNECFTCDPFSIQAV